MNFGLGPLAPNQIQNQGVMRVPVSPASACSIFSGLVMIAS